MYPAVGTDSAVSLLPIDVGGRNVTEEELVIVKTAPAVAGATIYGLTLQDWVAIVTLVYVALQVGLLVPKYWRLLRDWQRSKRS
jgi:hypothetical protein